MRESVCAIFVYRDEVFSITRQNYLSVFPGYTAFPGGKIDKSDKEITKSYIGELAKFEPYIMSALIREMNEEINFDLEANLDLIESIDYVGLAITPEFNPYRFKNYYYRINLKEKVEFTVDEGEASESGWTKACDLMASFERAEIMAVPPTVKLFKALEDNILFEEELDLSLPHCPETEVPMIESIYGVKQFLPLSHTFPPANRTNCFLIGDSKSVLIDPSPRDEQELEKLIKHVDKFSVDEVFLTHHHPDHHERSVKVAKYYGVKMGMSEDTYERILARHGEDYFLDTEIHFYSEGDILTQSLGKDIQIYEVPGHDEGQLAIAPSTMNWFLVGDLIQTIGTVVIGAPEGDMLKYFESLNRVIDLSPKFIIPSHGIAIGGTHKLSKTLGHRQEREDQIKNLKQSGKSNQEILDVIYEAIDPKLHKYAMKTIVAHLKKLNL
ncbi:hypothetical protein A9Q84_06515 [Halobacteriovorax marinus]|uniref:Nudix hydrolase domain-containing protein n=1 Tax=Halobacteriovorax marinus TaxID=97084 RepID=A0A1Y5F9W3_9BACT|nr:hypothetical protein A9Q84_06515 [Halobacteriovorax marinus]